MLSPMLPDALKGVKIILASKSPRRQQLIRELGINVDYRCNGEQPETYPEHLSMTEIPVYLAEQKAKDIIPGLKRNEILITSDTIVWCNGKIIGKPADEVEAFTILKQLSGEKHVVVTGICFSTIKGSYSFYDCTDVYFRKLTHEEIRYYINKYKPFDKAGAYGIQEWIGFIGVERIDGSFYNVMGLPVHKLYTELLRFYDEQFT